MAAHVPHPDELTWLDRLSVWWHFKRDSSALRREMKETKCWAGYRTYYEVDE